jgi:hypothetical protein
MEGAVEVPQLFNLVTGEQNRSMERHPERIGRAQALSAGNGN